MKYSSLPKWQRIAVPFVSIALGMFYFARYFVADELIDAKRQITVLQQDLQSTQALLTEERSRSSVAEREADVMRRANKLLRDSERKRQDEVAGLQADLDFYRRLGGANGSQSPLNVHHLEIEPMRSPRVYRVIFSLTQNLRWATVVSGEVELELDGIRNGAAEHLDNKQLLAESVRPLSFQFKYFQQLECLITLPEGFEASRLTIQLRSKDRKSPVKQSMDWQGLINKTKIEQPADGTS